MTVTIGRKPVIYYTDDQLKTMGVWEFNSIISDNGWEEKLNMEEIKKKTKEELFPIISTLMNEWRMETKPPTK